MSLEKESELRKSTFERERDFEARENKEGEADPELQAAAAMERADLLVKEVKSGKQKIQNILIHVQQVQQAIRKLRQQLQLADDEAESSSVQQDQEMIAKLKEEIRGYQDELLKMRGDLIREEIEQLKEGMGVGMTAEELQARAEKSVDEMISGVLEE